MSSLSLPPPKRSKQTTLLEIFRGASSHESDADNEDDPDADRLVSEPEDDRTITNDAESPSSQSPPSALVPALEVATQCSSECCAVNDPTPFQPKDTTTIARTRRQQGQKRRMFCTTWYATYPWLTLCCTRTRVFCTYCRFCVRNGKCLCTLFTQANERRIIFWVKCNHFS